MLQGKAGRRWKALDPPVTELYGSTGLGGHWCQLERCQVEVVKVNIGHIFYSRCHLWTPAVRCQALLGLWEGKKTNNHVCLVTTMYQGEARTKFIASGGHLHRWGHRGPHYSIRGYITEALNCLSELEQAHLCSNSV